MGFVVYSEVFQGYADVRAAPAVFAVTSSPSLAANAPLANPFPPSQANSNSPVTNGIDRPQT